MAERKNGLKAKPKSGSGFTAEERSAMKERVRELKASASKADGERDILAKIAEMPAPDRRLAERLHVLITTNAPGLRPRTWYGMPAYANDEDVVCFFQPASKFKARYATLGFGDAAKLDEGHMWPTVYAILELSATEEARIAALVRKAVA
ncbi:MAG: DUF1801 domain-containing protein [Thermoplasmata archaeon]|nr:DUF1801 domain-containing protein [Thermoplasmata archaeon]MCI4362427.1 DUF1801 domain-containing protein [Thermoplasmata archaeon]